MILITGATGNIGRHVVTMLLEEGQDVRALTRDPEHAGLPTAVEVLAGDFDAVETLKPAMEGVDTILLATYGPATGTRDANVASAAAAAGVSRIVKISIAGVEVDSDPVSTWHRSGEESIDRAGIPRTFLRCGELMSTALWWAHTIRASGKVFVPFADAPSAPIDPVDVAAVAVRCLVDLRPDSLEALVLTGTEVLTSRARVQRLGEALGTTLACVEVPREAAFERMVAAGQPPVIARACLDMIQVKSRGPGAAPSNEVELVTGRPARTFDDWAARNIAAFR